MNLAPFPAETPLRRRSCSIVSIDFRDLDVIWNVQLFYACAGYVVSEKEPSSNEDLLVVLRGDPGQRFTGHRGIVHVYDYVKELDVDWKRCFPVAEKILLVSLFQPRISDPGITWIQGYLPVIPEFWQRQPFRKQEDRPLHIANLKPIGTDPYQQDLIRLARRGLIRVFGSNWDRLEIRTTGLSYLEANRLLAKAFCCYGLMYPYQRGSTLSGRMWQAPLHGCLVISEQGTNPLHLPGIQEVERFSPDTLLSVNSIQDCLRIRTQATQYWRDATDQLAQRLGLPVLHRPRPAQLSAFRRQMRNQHVRVVVSRLLTAAGRGLAPPPVSCWILRRRRTLRQLARFLRRPAA